jgi:hypothetical protein
MVETRVKKRNKPSSNLESSDLPPGNVTVSKDGAGSRRSRRRGVQATQAILTLACDTSTIDPSLLDANAWRNIHQAMSAMEALAPPASQLERQEQLQKTAKVVLEAYQFGAASYGMADAIRWGGNFEFPHDIRTRDARMFQEAGGDLQEVARLLQLQLRPNRISKARVIECITDDLIQSMQWKEGVLDRKRLLDLAIGMEVPVMEDFIANESPPKMRKKYELVAVAVNKLMYEQWKLGLLIMLPTEVVRSIPGIHFSSTHWTPKKGKEWGRPLGDSSNVEEGDSALNDPALKLELERLYGAINTIVLFCTLLYSLVTLIPVEF